eukprot:CAMPEP_0118923756 /NCGR_PEP_ID=MMETSP1169-20130426/2168_1 /TAXON_ID=36882 /ORGANISM="Pyramimonas obovata, Strain CCMP722" /LENGTH=164 /DNA_ID=CAMNT_0006864791 /DNA_START=59 /DNA_END=551 /DNA_ORIENTATION=+
MVSTHWRPPPSSSRVRDSSPIAGQPLGRGAPEQTSTIQSGHRRACPTPTLSFQQGGRASPSVQPFSGFEQPKHAWQDPNPLPFHSSVGVHGAHQGWQPSAAGFGTDYACAWRLSPYQAHSPPEKRTLPERFAVAACSGRASPRFGAATHAGPPSGPASPRFEAS